MGSSSYAVNTRDYLSVPGLKVNRRDGHREVAKLSLVDACNTCRLFGHRQKVCFSVCASSCLAEIVSQENFGIWAHPKNVVLVCAVPEFAVPDGCPSKFIRIASLSQDEVARNKLIFLFFATLDRNCLDLVEIQKSVLYIRYAKVRYLDGIRRVDFSSLRDSRSYGGHLSKRYAGKSFADLIVVSEHFEEERRHESAETIGSLGAQVLNAYRSIQDPDNLPLRTERGQSDKYILHERLWNALLTRRTCETLFRFLPESWLANEVTNVFAEDSVTGSKYEEFRRAATDSIGQVPSQSNLPIFHARRNLRKKNVAILECRETS